MRNLLRKCILLGLQKSILNLCNMVLVFFSIYKSNCCLYLFRWKSISHPRDYDKLTKINMKTSAHFIQLFSKLCQIITSNKYLLKSINSHAYKNRMSYKNTSIHNKVKLLKFRTFHTLREMWLEFHQPFRESYIYCNCKKKWC